MSLSAPQHVVVNSFADHVDAIPFYMGYTPTEMLILTTLRTSGVLEHRVSPVGPIVDGGSLNNFVTIDFADVSLVLVALLGLDKRLASTVLRWTVDALEEAFIPLINIGMGTPQVSAGWASSGHYAEMHRNGTLGPSRPRPVSDIALAALMAGW